MFSFKGIDNLFSDKRRKLTLPDRTSPLNPSENFIESSRCEIFNASPIDMHVESVLVAQEPVGGCTSAAAARQQLGNRKIPVEIFVYRWISGMHELIEKHGNQQKGAQSLWIILLLNPVFSCTQANTSTQPRGHVEWLLVEPLYLLT